jgi:hypothetical protein
MSTTAMFRIGHLIAASGSFIVVDEEWIPVMLKHLPLLPVATGFAGDAHFAALCVKVRRRLDGARRRRPEHEFHAAGK